MWRVGKNPGSVKVRMNGIRSSFIWKEFIYLKCADMSKLLLQGLSVVSAVLVSACSGVEGIL